MTEGALPLSNTLDGKAVSPITDGAIEVPPNCDGFNVGQDGRPEKSGKTSIDGLHEKDGNDDTASVEVGIEVNALFSVGGKVTGNAVVGALESGIGVGA